MVYMEHHIDPIDSAILRLRFSGRSLDSTAEVMESDPRLVRLREAKAMNALRTAGFSDGEIRDHFGH